MRRLAILAALLVAGLAWAQEYPSAEESWSSLLMVLGGLVGLTVLVVGGAAAWRILSRPLVRIGDALTAHLVRIERLERIVYRPDDGAASLVSRLGLLETEAARSAELDALRTELVRESDARTAAHAAQMALLRRIHAHQRRDAGLPADEPTEG